MSFFSSAANFNFLLRYYSYKSGTEDGKKALSMVTKTLEFMEKGGIHDHIGQVRIDKCCKSFSVYRTCSNSHGNSFTEKMRNESRVKTEEREE